MIEVLPESAGDTLAFKATETLTDDDYKQVFIPRLEEGLAAGGGLKVMLVLDEGFAGWEPHAMWDDARWGLEHRKDFAKLVVVGGPAWVDWAMRVANHLLEGEVRTFDLAQRDEAWAWVTS